MGVREGRREGKRGKGVSRGERCTEGRREGDGREGGREGDGRERERGRVERRGGRWERSNPLKSIEEELNHYTCSLRDSAQCSAVQCSAVQRSAGPPLCLSRCSSQAPTARPRTHHEQLLVEDVDDPNDAAAAAGRQPRLGAGPTQPRHGVEDLVTLGGREGGWEGGGDEGRQWGRRRG